MDHPPCLVPKGTTRYLGHFIVRTGSPGDARAQWAASSAKGRPRGKPPRRTKEETHVHNVL